MKDVSINTCRYLVVTYSPFGRVPKDQGAPVVSQFNAVTGAQSRCSPPSLGVGPRNPNEKTRDVGLSIPLHLFKPDAKRTDSPSVHGQPGSQFLTSGVCVEKSRFTTRFFVFASLLVDRLFRFSSI